MTHYSPQQREAIESLHPTTCVIATAGAGKTRTLVGATQYLANEGVPPSRMVVITFTNAAAAELRRRSHLEFGYCGTLHGYLLRLLQKHGQRINLYPPLTVIDEEMRKQMLDEVINEVGAKNCTKTSVDEALARGPVDLKASGDTGRDAIAALAYYQKLEDGSLLDYDAILHYGLKVIQALEPHEMEISHLFVDEFQDSARLDAKIYAALPIRYRFFVADFDQSIYGFRGADAKNAQSVIEQPDVHIVRLEDCHRCDEAICRAAQTLIEHNAGRIPKQTRSMTGETGEVNVSAHDSDRDEIVEMACRINAILQANAETEIAVLVRTNALVEYFRDGLRGFQVPVQQRDVVATPPDWKRAMQHLRLLQNPDNDELAYRWIVSAAGKREADKARIEALEKGVSLNEVSLCLPALDLSGLPQAMAKAGIGAESLNRIDQALEALPPGATLPELAYALSSEDVKQTMGGGVRVCTMHAAKGLEFDIVFLPAFEQGICPMLSRSADLEEERRLAFVAFTRARHRLEISHAGWRTPPRRYDKVEMKPSPFIEEAKL